MSLPNHHSNDKNDSNKIDFIKGDIFYLHHDHQFNLYKLLAIESAFECYHILTYQPVEQLPSPMEISKLQVFIYHAPIDKKAFDEAVFIAHEPIVANDLIGYHEYLRQTQDPSYYVSIANEYFQTAYHLTDEGKHMEAIDSYSKAIDLIPQFYEAIDNRAFCKMDLGLWTEAIEDFKLSLEQHPASVLAEFSIGECYFKMAQYLKAKEQFERALQIDPHDEITLRFMEKVN
jgi:tetratricopeptide (TPR) repeat protein